MTMRLLRDLQSFALPGYAVVAPNLTVFLQAERVLQGRPGVGDVGRTGVRCRDPEPGIEVSHEHVPQIDVGRLGRGMSAHPQLQRYAPLQGAEHAFHPHPVLQANTRECAEYRVAPAPGRPG